MRNAHEILIVLYPVVQGLSQCGVPNYSRIPLLHFWRDQVKMMQTAGKGLCTQITFGNTLNAQTIYITCNLQNSLPFYLQVFIKWIDNFAYLILIIPTSLWNYENRLKYCNIKTFYTTHHSSLKYQLARSAVYVFSHHRALSIVFHLLWSLIKKRHFYSVKQYTYSF
jgi:hypothetical protein